MPHTPSQQRQFIALAATCVLLIASLFGGAPFPSEQRLQHIPTAAALAALTIAAQRRALSGIAFGGLVAFLWLHIIGARWIYSYTPYDDWTESLVGVRLSSVFGWTRNHYDRFVHLAFGALAAPAIVEVLRQYAGVRRAWAAALAVCVVMAIGSAYEIAEWQAAVWLSPENAEAYNGQQGDMWDAQKDMALAAAGAIVAATGAAIRGDKAWPESRDRKR